jgi:hypothetical protein
LLHRSLCQVFSPFPVADFSTSNANFENHPSIVLRFCGPFHHPICRGGVSLPFLPLPFRSDATDTRVPLFLSHSGSYTGADMVLQMTRCFRAMIQWFIFELPLPPPSSEISARLPRSRPGTALRDGRLRESRTSEPARLSDAD